MSVLGELSDSGMAYSLDFWKYTLQAMQNDQTSGTSQCMTTWDSFVVNYNDLSGKVEDDAYYVASLAEKGTGEGTSAGFWVQKIQNYMDITIDFVNVYNSCDVVEYVRACSKALTSWSGFTNQLMNLAYRFFSHEDEVNYYNMSVAIEGNDS